MAEQTKALVLAAGIAVLMILCNNAAAAPTITSATNSQTGISLHVHPDYGDTVIFTVTADEAITTWTWHADGYDQFNNAATLSIPYATFGYHNVSVYGTNAGGNTNTITWIVWVSRELRDTPAEEMDETAYDMLQESIEGEPSLHNMMLAVSYPYTSTLGLIFYLFLFGLPLLMMYIRQDSITIPATLMFLLGGVIIATLPMAWQIIAGGLMGLAMMGMIYKLFKERG